LAGSSIQSAPSPASQSRKPARRSPSSGRNSIRPRPSGQAGEFKVLEADLQLALAQTKINEVEAAAPDMFRGGWRPAAGWVCVAGLAYQFLFQPLAAWSGSIQGWAPPPVLDLGDLYGLLFGMLGLGAYRSFERLKGKA
jgi:hypothetical protein